MEKLMSPKMKTPKVVMAMRQVAKWPFLRRVAASKRETKDAVA